ncbi:MULTISPECIES: response regulator transcription factor [Lentzea]|jgi:two-component system response regulator DesR|uniref:Two-component system, NarL family, response regulator DesR n=1 Tax=Lentzea flaviverrucosa TaxID=200379 RepID=A0A1H9XLD1_9PSEU|nr:MULTISPECIES: response regulator transcription factor [Lentzea]RDI20396.1 LuxR family two component transcriptional regulator [Lentzea flaviverrucosa]WUD20938.1 response regulator transcription factor [Lentzea sp. NBC_00516]SES46924.1 two-component system, NarL family, response regulator DesR [Lentzea flaviverrucosa]
MIRVLLAEDMHMVRGALIALLNLEPDIEVVAEVSSGDKIVPAARQHGPDVCVIDIDLPILDGLSAASTIRETMPQVRTLMLTSLGRPGTLRRALAARVDGFLLKDAPPTELADAIRRVAAGERVVDSQLALAAWDRGECPLTDRELEVLRLAANGADAPDIAVALSLSVGTVRNYMTTIMTKLNGRNRVDAIRIAEEAGWL